MRAAAFLLSLVVHCGGIGGAIVASAGTSRSKPSEPRVELQASEAATAQPVEDVVVPQVIVEPVPFHQAPTEVDSAEEQPARVAEALATAEPCTEPLQIAAAVWRARTPRPAADATAFVAGSPLADNEPPGYPLHDRNLGHEGTVLVLAHLDARGNVLEVELDKPSPHPGLNRAALQAVRAWRFEPARQRGVAVRSRLQVPIVFRLKGP